MNNLTRRKFLEQIGAAAGLLLATRIALPFPNLSFLENAKPFEMLVVGDSHISGQGLREKDKFYYLVKEWLGRDVFGASRQVNLKVKAHSGARIDLHKEELELLMKAGDDINKFHHAEANLSQPSILKQIDFARKEYETPESVDLVMLSGSITDVLVANTINPFLKEKKVRGLIHKYCNESMLRLLEHTTDTFPNALVVVIGYFPIISTKSDVNKISRYLFKAVKFPHQLHFLLTNGMSKQLLMKIIRKKIALRSRMWVKESNREIREAIGKMNAKFDKPKVIFVESPITEDNCYGTKNSMLWETDKDNLPEDQRYGERKEMCPKVFAELKHHHYGKMSVRMCELAAIAHPNVQGSKAFAEAVKNSLERFSDSPHYGILRK